MKVPFNQPYISSVNFQNPDILRTLGKNYDRCKTEIKKQLGVSNIILTPSCTDALELAALTLGIEPGDEVILPSYTYVSTANAFALRGAQLVFVDTKHNHPSIDLTEVEKKITSKTKAIVVVHYGGIAFDIALLKKIKKTYKVPVIEDAAHCFGSFYGSSPMGTLGDMATFSFHETKNISCGQGGALIINNKKYVEKAQVIAYCGTNKLAFIKNKADHYSWQNLGSNFLLAEPLCAILLASLKRAQKINKKRSMLWQTYYHELNTVQGVNPMPFVKGGNGHIFYLIMKNLKERNKLIDYLRLKNIEATFHYSPLHSSSYALKNIGKSNLPNTENFGACLVRLPLFYQLTEAQQDYVIKEVKSFYGTLQ